MRSATKKAFTSAAVGLSVLGMAFSSDLQQAYAGATNEVRAIKASLPVNGNQPANEITVPFVNLRKEHPLVAHNMAGNIAEQTGAIVVFMGTDKTEKSRSIANNVLGAMKGLRVEGYEKIVLAVWDADKHKDGYDLKGNIEVFTTRGDTIYSSTIKNAADTGKTAVMVRESIIELYKEHIGAPTPPLASASRSASPALALSKD